MKFKLEATQLISALEVVQVVTPRAVTSQGGSGYLFVAKGDKCYIYSRDSTSVARAECPIQDLDEGGSFVYPAEAIGALKFLDGFSITFESKVEDGEKFFVSYSASNGAKAERTSFNPQLLSTCDDDLNGTTTTYEFPPLVLREAITLSRPFLAKANDTRTEDQYKALQMFDASNPEMKRGDGHLFSSNSTQVFYFWCEAFLGKHFEVHGQHLPALLSFLTKSTGPVTFRLGAHFTFAQNSAGHVYGWPKHAKTHAKFSYYALAKDMYVLAVDRVPLLGSLQYLRSELSSQRDKIKLIFNHDRKLLQFAVSEGNSKVEAPDVQVRPKNREGTEDPWMEPKDVTCAVNVDHLIDLVSSVKSNQVEIRILLVPKGDREVAMIRTVDEFRLDPATGKCVVEGEGTLQCRVTRFMPSKD